MTCTAGVDDDSTACGLASASGRAAGAGARSSREQMRVWFTVAWHALDAVSYNDKARESNSSVVKAKNGVIIISPTHQSVALSRLSTGFSGPCAPNGEYG